MFWIMAKSTMNEHPMRVTQLDPLTTHLVAYQQHVCSLRYKYQHIAGNVCTNKIVEKMDRV